MNMLVFDGHVRNIVNLKYDINSTFTISSAVEVNSVIDTTECKHLQLRPRSSFVTVSC